MGPERTRTELLPYLCGTDANLSTELVDDEDEIVVTLAEALGEFTEVIGGPSQVLCLLKPLELMAGAEEPLVRDKVDLEATSRRSRA